MSSTASDDDARQSKAALVALPDTDTLTPKQELVMEVLAARWRLGEQVWTFGSRHVGTLNQLGNLGYVGYKSGIVERTYLAWMTPAGRAAALDESYVPPVLREPAKVSSITSKETP